MSIIKHTPDINYPPGKTFYLVDETVLANTMYIVKDACDKGQAKVQ